MMDIRQEKLRRLSAWRAGIPAGPITLELNPTNRCNLACISCWQRKFEYDETDYLSTERLLSLVREAAALGVKEVRIPGAGEPMLRNDLLDLMEEIKRQGMHGLLINNGTAWTKEKICRVVAMRWDCLTFSIDAPEASANDFLRGRKGTFALITKNLRRLNEEKELMHSSLPLLRFNTVLSGRNYRLLPEMVELAHAYHCEDLQVQPMTVWGRDGESIALTELQREELPQYVERALALADEYDIYTNMAGLLTTGIVARASGKMDVMVAEQTADIDDAFMASPCFEPFYNLVILPNGVASFCSISGGKDGDSILNKSLNDVWHGSAYKAIRRTLLEKNLREYCTRCCSVVNMENQSLREGLIAITSRT